MFIVASPLRAADRLLHAVELRAHVGRLTQKTIEANPHGLY